VGLALSDKYEVMLFVSNAKSENKKFSHFITFTIGVRCDSSCPNYSKNKRKLALLQSDCSLKICTVGLINRINI
jgi:hypothetical protein